MAASIIGTAPLTAATAPATDPGEGDHYEPWDYDPLFDGFLGFVSHWADWIVAFLILLILLQIVN